MKLLKINRKSINKVIINLAVFLITIGVLMVIIEFSLSFIMPPPIKWHSSQARLMNDDELGWKYIPNQKAFHQMNEVKINSLGFRTYEPDNASDEFRIMVLGDSVTFGSAISKNERFSNILEQKLIKYGINAKVYNFGVPGYSQYNEKEVLKRYFNLIDPDLIIVAFIENDIGENYKFNTWNFTLNPRINKQGEFKSGILFDTIPKYFFNKLRELRFFLLLRNAYENFKRSKNKGVDYRQELFASSTDYKVVTEGWNLTNIYFQEMKDFLEDKKAAFMIVNLPLNHVLDYIKINGDKNIGLLTQIKDIADKNGIIYIDLTGVFFKNYESFDALYVHYDGHPNRYANKLIADNIFIYITENKPII